MMGRVIHTGQVVIDLTLRIEAIPEPGGDVFADESSMAVGGGFNVLAAARRMGVETLYAGPLGEGPFAEAARRALEEIGVDHVGPVAAGDQGYCVAMTDARAERTFISTCGAETRGPVDAFDHLEVSGDDVVYLSGYSLADEASRVALERLAGRLTKARAGCTALFDVSPMVGSVPMSSLEHLGALGPSGLSMSVRPGCSPTAWGCGWRPVTTPASARHYRVGSAPCWCGSGSRAPGSPTAARRAIPQASR